MSKFILDNEFEKNKMSTYTDDDNKDIVDYLISILGDVEISKEDMRIFVRQFNRSAGDYDVLTEPNTIKTMYSIKEKHPLLSPEAINCLFPKYIDDLFEKENLANKMDNLIDIFGLNDDMFEVYLSYIDRKALTLQEEYVEKSKIFNDLRGLYSNNFIEFLEYLTLRRHYDPEIIINNIPTNDFIEKDEKCLKELSEKYRIFMGLDYPISYRLLEKSIINDLTDMSEEMSYVIKIDNKTIKQNACFSLEEYNKNVKQKKLVISK